MYTASCSQCATRFNTEGFADKGGSEYTRFERRNISEALQIWWLLKQHQKMEFIPICAFSRKAIMFLQHRLQAWFRLLRSFDFLQKGPNSEDARLECCNFDRPKGSVKCVWRFEAAPRNSKGYLAGLSQLTPLMKGHCPAFALLSRISSLELMLSAASNNRICRVDRCCNAVVA